MRRKHNPYLALAALLLLALIVSWICGGCSVRADAAEKKVERFTVEYAGNCCSIITDHETGIQYLLYKETSNYGKGVGMTKLEVAP